MQDVRSGAATQDAGSGLVDADCPGGRLSMPESGLGSRERDRREACDETQEATGQRCIGDLTVIQQLICPSCKLRTGNTDIKMAQTDYYLPANVACTNGKTLHRANIDVQEILM